MSLTEILSDSKHRAEAFANAKLLSKLGDGGSGTSVWLCTVEGHECAVKILDLEHIGFVEASEIAMLRHLLLDDEAADSDSAYHDEMSLYDGDAGSASDYGDDDGDEACYDVALGAFARDSRRQMAVRFVAEIKLLQQLRHDNIITYYGHHFNCTNMQLQLFMQHAPLSLDSLIKHVARSRSNPRQVRRSRSHTLAEQLRTQPAAPAPPPAPTPIAGSDAAAAASIACSPRQLGTSASSIIGALVPATLVSRWWTFDVMYDIVRSLAAGTAYLHAQTPLIVHRDIKPGNVVLEFSDHFLANGDSEPGSSTPQLFSSGREERRQKRASSRLRDAFSSDGSVTSADSVVSSASTGGSAGAPQGFASASAPSTGSSSASSPSSSPEKTPPSSSNGSDTSIGCADSDEGDGAGANANASIFKYVKLIDFDASRELDVGKQACTIVGTPPYTAPDVFTSTGYTDKADTWSFAMTLYEMLTLRTPYSDGRANDVPQRICSGMLPPIPQTMSEAFPNGVPRTSSLMATLGGAAPPLQIGAGREPLPPESVLVPVALPTGELALPDCMRPFIALMQACLVQNPAERPAMSRVSYVIDQREHFASYGNEDDSDDEGANEDEMAEAAAERELAFYKTERQIGQGQFGFVFVATDSRTRRSVALKHINKLQFSTSDDWRFLEREVFIMRMLKHENIIELLDVIDLRDELVLVLEMAPGGTLQDYVIKSPNQRLDERAAGLFFAQLVAALTYCHGKRVVHRDLKLENIMLSADKRKVKLIDFGLSSTYQTNQGLQTFCGSPMFVAPEVLEHKAYSGTKCDVWSCGIILYAMLSGRMPFSGNMEEFFQRVFAGRYRKLAHVSPECSDLVAHMIVVDPVARFSLQQVREHPWVRRMASEHAVEPALFNPERAAPRSTPISLSRAGSMFPVSPLNETGGATLSSASSSQPPPQPTMEINREVVKIVHDLFSYGEAEIVRALEEDARVRAAEFVRAAPSLAPPSGAAEGAGASTLPERARTISIGAGRERRGSRAEPVATNGRALGIAVDADRARMAAAYHLILESTNANDRPAVEASESPTTATAPRTSADGSAPEASSGSGRAPPRSLAETGRQLRALLPRFSNVVTAGTMAAAAGGSQGSTAGSNSNSSSGARLVLTRSSDRAKNGPPTVAVSAQPQSAVARLVSEEAAARIEQRRSQRRSGSFTRLTVPREYIAAESTAVLRSSGDKPGQVGGATQHALMPMVAPSQPPPMRLVPATSFERTASLLWSQPGQARPADPANDECEAPTRPAPPPPTPMPAPSSSPPAPAVFMTAIKLASSMPSPFAQPPPSPSSPSAPIPIAAPSTSASTQTPPANHAQTYQMLPASAPCGNLIRLAGQTQDWPMFCREAAKILGAAEHNVEALRFLLTDRKGRVSAELVRKFTGFFGTDIDDSAEALRNAALERGRGTSPSPRSGAEPLSPRSRALSGTAAAHARVEATTRPQSPSRASMPIDAFSRGALFGGAAAAFSAASPPVASDGADLASALGSDQGALDRVLDVCTLPYFFGWLSGKDAETLLRQRDYGHYLLRFNGKRAHAYTLSAKCADAKVRHWIIEQRALDPSNPNSMRAYVIGNSIYLSVADLVTAHGSQMLQDSSKLECVMLHHACVRAQR